MYLNLDGQQWETVLYNLNTESGWQKKLSCQRIFVTYNKSSFAKIIIDNVIVNVPYETYILHLFR